MRFTFPVQYSLRSRRAWPRWFLMTSYNIFSGFYLCQNQSTEYLSNANSLTKYKADIIETDNGFNQRQPVLKRTTEYWLVKIRRKIPIGLFVLKLLESEVQPPRRIPVLFRIDTRPNLWRTTKAAYHNPWDQRLYPNARGFLSEILKRALRSKRAERSTPSEHRPVGIELAIQ